MHQILFRGHGLVSRSSNKFVHSVLKCIVFDVVMLHLQISKFSQNLIQQGKIPINSCFMTKINFFCKKKRYIQNLCLQCPTQLLKVFRLMWMQDENRKRSSKKHDVPPDRLNSTIYLKIRLARQNTNKQLFHDEDYIFARKNGIFRICASSAPPSY